MFHTSFVVESYVGSLVEMTHILNGFKLPTTSTSWSTQIPTGMDGHCLANQLDIWVLVYF